MPEVVSPAGSHQDSEAPLLIIPTLIKGVFSDEQHTQFTATRQLHRLLHSNNVPVTSVMTKDVLPRLVEFLKTGSSRLQFEAASILAIILSPDSVYVEKMIELDAIPYLVKLLSSPKSDIQVVAIWALGSIAAVSLQARDCVLDSGALPCLIRLLAENPRNSMLENGAWALSTFFRGTAQKPDWALVSSALPALVKLLDSPDPEVLTDTCWALSHLTSYSDNLQDIVDTGISERVIELLTNGPSSLQQPALRIFGNIAASDDQVEGFLVPSIISLLFPLLLSPQPLVRRDTCWTISNIATDHAQALMDERIIPRLAEILNHDEPSVRKEASWALRNILTAPASHPSALKCFTSLCGALEEEDKVIVGLSLDSLKSFFRATKVGWYVSDMEAQNQFTTHIESVNALSIIHRLQYHDELHLRKRACSLMAEFFDSHSLE